jgi:hypothetical protein
MAGGHRDLFDVFWWLAALTVIGVAIGGAVLLLAGCGVPDFVEDPNGTVYTCTGGAHDEEWCSVLTADELSAARELDCHETGVGDRWWPGVTNGLGHGCDYSCEPHVGCNAKSGCYCGDAP